MEKGRAERADKPGMSAGPEGAVTVLWKGTNCTK